MPIPSAWRAALRQKFEQLLDECDPAGPFLEVSVFFPRDDRLATILTVSVAPDEIEIVDVPPGRLEEL